MTVGTVIKKDTLMTNILNLYLGKLGTWLDGLMDLNKKDKTYLERNFEL